MEHAAALPAGLTVLVQLAMGIGLAASAGLRAFLPLLVVGAAGRLDLGPLAPAFRWLESWPALTVFGVAVATEILADKFPVIDHFLDAAQTFVKPVAGTILAASVLAELSPLQATVLGLITGGVSAGAVHAAKAKLRLASTVATAGMGNPLLSAGEDAVALLGSVTAVLAPLLVLPPLILGGWFCWVLVRRRRSRRAARGGA